MDGGERREARADLLIIDDDPDVSDALGAVLQDEGYTVALAPDGQRGLDYLRAGAPPSLILLDLMMPVLDGYGFRAAQLGDPRLAPIPVLVLTAGAIDERALSLGAAACLRKPVLLDALLTEIERLAGPPRGP